MNSQFFDQRNDILSSKQFCLLRFNVIADCGALGPSHPFKIIIMNYEATASEKINLDKIVIQNNDVFFLLSSAKIERR